MTKGINKESNSFLSQASYYCSVRVPRLSQVLFILMTVLVMVKPAIRIASFRLPHKPGTSQVYSVKAFAHSRAKFDQGSGKQTRETQKSGVQPISFAFPQSLQRSQQSLAGVISKRDLTNIMFRILPERKIFLRQGRLSV